MSCRWCIIHRKDCDRYCFRGGSKDTIRHTEGETITILELARNYNHTVFKVIFHIKHDANQIEVIGGKVGLDTAKVTIEGPIF
jgi:hypothetical protein